MCLGLSEASEISLIGAIIQQTLISKIQSIFAFMQAVAAYIIRPLSRAAFVSDECFNYNLH